MSANIWRYLFLGALVVAAPAVHADRLMLKNGDVLTGTVLHKAGDALRFSTPYAGVLKVRWASVMTIETDRPVRVMLDDGSHYEASMVAAGEGVAGLEVAQDAPAVAVDEDERDGSQAPNGAIAVAEHDLREVLYINPTPEESGRGYRLTGRANFAFSNASGNTDNEQLHGDAEMVMRAKLYRYTLGGEATRASDDGNVSASSARLYTSYDWFFRPKMFIYAKGSLERDRFKDIALRSVLGGGYGYQWIETETTKLALRGGPDFVDIDHYDARNEQFVAFGWNLDFSHKLTLLPVELFHAQDGYRGLNDEGAVVLKTRTGLRVPLSYGFNATAQLNLDWESDPAPGREETDRTVLLGLGYEFK
jgi:putative salt-induced outer membrane protein YdiY